MVTLYSTGTEYTANAITLLRGTVSDIISVGVYHNTDPNIIPAVGDFNTVTLVDGTAEPPDALSEAGFIDVLSRIGARAEAGVISLAAGDHQRWVLLTTADEDIIRPVDIVEVL